LAREEEKEGEEKEEEEGRRRPGAALVEERAEGESQSRPYPKKCFQEVFFSQFYYIGC